VSDTITCACEVKGCLLPAEVVGPVNSALGYGKAPAPWGLHCSPPDAANRAVSWGGRFMMEFGELRRRCTAEDRLANDAWPPVA
jgi:hypothetical protein